MSSFSERLSSSRGTTIALGVGAAILAGVLLIVYLANYRDSVAAENSDTSVLVAKALIPAGTSGTVIASKDLYQAATFPQKDVKDGAVTDPAYLDGRVAVADILPNQQLTEADFSTTTTGLVNTKISGEQRAIAVSLDNVHGNLAQLRAGDFIDIYVGLGARNDNGQSVVTLFRRSVLVLSAPTPTTDENLTSNDTNAAGDGGLVLRVRARDAADFAYAADNTQMYFVLRPKSGAKPTPNDTASVSTILGRG
jgi:Flp pilus assembly protein CpaB